MSVTGPVNTSANITSRRQLYDAIRIGLEGERSTFIHLWRNLNDYITPMRARFQTTDGNRGDRRSRNIIHERATLAARTLSSGMMSGITNPARDWFRLTTPDPDLAEKSSVKEWLYTVTERVKWVLSRTNFYNKAFTFYKDLGVYATAGMFCVEDDKHVVRFIDLPVGSFCVANGPDDTPEVVTRTFRVTARQLVRQFGLNNCSRPVRTAWTNGRNTEAWYDVVHIILRNDEQQPFALHSRDAAPWLSVYYEMGAPVRPSTGEPEFLSQKGYYDMPVFIGIWEGTGEDVYGTDSPGITALGSVRSLQAMERRGLQGLEKMVNPPMTGPTSLQSVRATILPGEITYVDVREGQQGFKPAHEVNLALDKLGGKQQEVESRINEAFYVDVFRIISMLDEQAGTGTRQRTATEIQELKEEKLIALGPVLEQLNPRFLDPVIDRVYNAMLRRGFIPPAPPDIHGVKLKVEYISMLHQAQKAGQIGGYRTLLEFVEPLIKADPSIMDKVNTDKIIEHVNDATGNAPDAIVPQDKVDQIRQARAKQAAQKQQTEQMQQSGDAAKKLAAADTSKKNMLTDILSNPDAANALGGGGGQ